MHFSAFVSSSASVAEKRTRQSRGQIQAISHTGHCDDNERYFLDRSQICGQREET